MDKDTREAVAATLTDLQNSWDHDTVATFENLLLARGYEVVPVITPQPIVNEVEASRILREFLRSGWWSFVLPIRVQLAIQLAASKLRRI